MSGQHETRKKFGYVLVALKESLNGFDTGAGLVKIPLWLAGLAVTAIFAPYILGIAIPLGILFAIRAVIDERENHKKIEEKEKQLEQLELEAYRCEQELEFFFRQDDPLNQKLYKDLYKKENNNNFLFNQALYQDLYNQGLNNVNSKSLLKYLLREYLDAIEHAKRKKNGRLPNQGKIFDSIKSVTGYDNKDPKFLEKMAAYLEDANLHAKLTRFYNAVPFEKYEDQPVDPTIKNSISQRFRNAASKVKTFLQKHKRLRSIGRRIVDFISDFGMGMGIAASLMTLFGVISLTNPITAPLILVVIGAGLAYGGITLAYNLYVDKGRKQVIQKLDKKIKDKKTNIALAKRILKIKKRKAKGEYAEVGNALDDQEHQQKHTYISKITPKLPLAFKLRIAASTVAQSVGSIALGMAVGMGLVWIATLMLPALPFLMPALVVGAIFTAYYLTRTIKASYKSAQTEVEKFKEIAVLEHDLKAKVGLKEFNRILLNEKKQEKDNRTLLKEIIIDYVDYLDRLEGGAVKFKKDLLSNKVNISHKKQEKVLALIEQVTGVKRGEDMDQFYNAVAHYLKGDNKDSTEANAVVQALKNRIQVPNTKLVDANDPKVNTKDGLLKTIALKFGKDHLLPILGVVGLALVVPIFLIGPQAFVAVGILGAIVIGAHIVSKVAQYKADKQTEKVTEKTKQLELIERKIKLEKDLVELRPKVQMEPKKEAVSVPENKDVSAGKKFPNSGPEVIVHKKFDAKSNRRSLPNFWREDEKLRLDEKTSLKPVSRKTVDVDLFLPPQETKLPKSAVAK